MESAAFTVCVPATSANLGPGFDALGLALAIHDEYRFAIAGVDSVTVSGEAAGETPTDGDNLVLRAAAHLARHAGRDLPTLAVTQTSVIPVSRGLGASGAGIVAGLVAADHLLETSLSETAIAGLAIEIEGHADNVVPALVGGLVVVAAGDELNWLPVDCPPSLKVAVAIPDLRITTRAAREVLPDTVPFADAVHNLSRAALLVAAVQQDRLELLGRAMEDRLHQPYRQTLHPALDAMLAAARDNGAAGAALSGSGSTVIALCRDDAGPAARAMQAACEGVGIACRQLVTEPAATGARVL
ncbi:MAG: homoserine kinase [Chloroflexota bacterium]|nr:homoserine kinase [Chloroflexota bacterium]MDP6758316.1 homoserine kinase [Chloroflexota bacterium]